MELLVGLVVIITLLFCLGLTFEVISMGFLLLLSGIMALTELFFIYCIAVILRSEKASAVFSRIGRKRGAKYECAFYRINGRTGDEDAEYPNIFPCEVVMRDKIYKRDKTVTVRLDSRHGRVFDRNAVLTCFVGAAMSALLPAVMIAVFLR